jgi:hypothetical protein
MLIIVLKYMTAAGPDMPEGGGNEKIKKKKNALTSPKRTSFLILLAIELDDAVDVPICFQYPAEHSGHLSYPHGGLGKGDEG